LAKGADVYLDVSVEKEACPLGLAPTASTTATLAMGDALAVAILEHRGFTAEDFAKSHPGGTLGRRLLLLIDDIMHTGDRIPCVDRLATLEATLIEITSKSLGFVTIVNDDRQVIGVFTDGDLRRVLGQNALDIRVTLIHEVMIPACKTIGKKALAAEALQLMESHKINALPVVNNQQGLIGAINMHDLLRAGVV